MEEGIDDSHNGNDNKCQSNKELTFRESGQDLTDSVTRDLTDYSKCTVNESKSLDSNTYTDSSSCDAIKDCCQSHDGRISDVCMTSEQFTTIRKDVFPSNDTGINSSVDSFDKSGSSYHCQSLAFGDLGAPKSSVDTQKNYPGVCGSSVDGNTCDGDISADYNIIKEQTPKIENDSKFKCLKVVSEIGCNVFGNSGNSNENVCDANVALTDSDRENPCAGTSTMSSHLAEFKSKNMGSLGDGNEKCEDDIEARDIPINNMSETNSSLTNLELAEVISPCVDPDHNIEIKTNISSYTDKGYDNNMMMIHGDELLLSIKSDLDERQKQSQISLLNITTAENKTIRNEDESKLSPLLDLADTTNHETSASSLGPTSPQNKTSSSTFSSDVTQSGFTPDNPSQDEKCGNPISDEPLESSPKTKDNASPNELASSTSPAPKPTTTPLTTASCPSSKPTDPPRPSPSPHLSRRFSVTKENTNLQPSQKPMACFVDKEEPPRQTKDRALFSFHESPPLLKTVSHTRIHRKNKVTKMGGCFQRFGHFGRKKKRKLSPPEEKDDETNVDDNIGGDDKENSNKQATEAQCENPETKFENAGGKMPKVCGEEVEDTVLVIEDTKREIIEVPEVIISSVSSKVAEMKNDINYTNTKSSISNTDTSNENSSNENNNNDNDKDIDNTTDSKEIDISSNGGVEESSNSPKPEVTENSEAVDTVAPILSDDPFKFSRSRIRPGSFRFRRAFSQRTRMKPLLENVASGSDDKDDNGDDDDDVEDLDALQFTAAASGMSGVTTGTGRRSGTFIHRRAFSLKRHFQSSTPSSHDVGSSPINGSLDSTGNKAHQRDNQVKSGGDNHHHHHHRRHSQQLTRSQSLKTQFMSFFVNLHGNDKASTPFTRTGSVTNDLSGLCPNVSESEENPEHSREHSRETKWGHQSPHYRTTGPTPAPPTQMAPMQIKYNFRYRRYNKHSLASVELSTWASRGSTRRSGTLTPFSSSLHPLGVTTRAEILQTISSAIIHLFQRKKLKENELGLLQEHVRFLMDAEAGGLIYEYYKDQLLRKGMVILREKIKNEQGLELLSMLGETWDYFFREILPNLQAILYPLAPVLANDESIRSLSLLAFRNIVVLKVSIREALDSVNKHSFPPSIQQMLLVLQGITDNVFLSENQFLLEKLVARVVCPYMGQRGVYEGGPEPVIKVKLKPLPLNIPLESSGVYDRIKSSRPDSSKPASSSSSSSLSQDSSKNKSGPVQNGNGEGGVKLKTVMEHLHDNGRRHSVVS